MENLEKECLKKLNKILSKFDLKIEKIEIVHIKSRNVWQYRLIDNRLSHQNSYSAGLCFWLSISDILIHGKRNNSIFDCLSSYSYKRYFDAYNTIKHLKNFCCLEEFMLKMDLMGV
jgi:hypothetical protein